MVRTHTDTQTIQNLFLKNTADTFNNGDRINIESSFQRGDEETGVWSREQQQNYIDSQQRHFPCGILTFVKDHLSATAYQDPWQVLDGGNRLRAVRDYMQDYYVDKNCKKFSELNPQQQAEFNTIQIPCQWMTIEREDPSNVIADMFCRLNTSAKPLSQGELFKAHGHRGDIWELELAKKIIGDTWSNNFKQYDNEVNYISTSWNKIFGSLGETRRCDNLAMMTGYILSAKNNCFAYFDKRYNKLNPDLSKPNQQPTSEEIETIFKKLNKFLNIMQKIYTSNIFGRVTKGLPSQSKIAPVWKKVCDSTLDDPFKNKMIKFYKKLDTDYFLLGKYKNLLTEGGNGETTLSKLENVFKMINDISI